MKNFVLLFLLGFTCTVFSQSKDYNTETRALFEASNWESLIEIAEEALANNNSTYQIEYRLAVAYYNTNKYFDSAEHFENIIKTFGINNDYIKEYLYYSYLFTGREKEALLISKDFSFHLQQKLEIKKIQFIDLASAAGGVKFSNRKDLGIENLSYFNVGLGQQFGYQFKLNHFFNSISQNYIDFDYKQKEYYINANIQISKGLTIIPAYHYINISENTTASYGGRRMGTLYSTSNYGKINLFHIGIKKQWNRFSVMPGITFSNTNLNDETAEDKETIRTQYGLDIGYTLKGFKDKIWIGLGTHVVTSDQENDFIWNAEIYYQINPKTFFSVNYLNANSRNFSTNNAAYYINSISTLVNKTSLTFGYHFTPKFSWILNYQYENNEDLDYNILFAYNTFITGLKYNF